MPSKTINMHGKLYDLLDEKVRVKKVAQTKAQEIRDGGQVAFLNPQKRKDKETNYWIYVADKSVRRTSSRKNVSIKILLEEYEKGTQNFIKWIKTVQEAQKVPENLPINESVKETLTIKEPKKVVPKKSKAATKKALATKKASKNSKK